MEAEKSTASNNFALAWFIKAGLVPCIGTTFRTPAPLHPCSMYRAEACGCRRGVACRQTSAWRR